MEQCENNAHYISAAHELACRVSEQVDRIDSERRVPAELAGIIADQGMFRLLVPRSLGGVEIDHPSFLKIIEIFALADASTAWCLSQNNVFATNAIRIPLETAREIWGDPRAVVSNGPPAASARAVPVEGGYQLSGRWDFSSGSPNATWVAALTPIVHQDAAGNLLRTDQNPRILLLPRKSVRFLDLWDVKGLRGTGSFSFEVDELFVPSVHTFDQEDESRETGPLYAIPRTLLFGSGNATVALGVARSSLNALIDLIGSRSRAGTATLQLERASTHRSIGEAEAIWRSAQAFLRDSAAIVWKEACNDGAPSLENRLQLRLAITHAIRMSVQVVETAYSLCGSSSIFAGNPMQRLFQDMHVIAQHIQGRATHYETAGQFVLGMETEGRF